MDWENLHIATTEEVYDALLIIKDFSDKIRKDYGPNKSALSLLMGAINLFKYENLKYEEMANIFLNFSNVLRQMQSMCDGKNG